MNRLLRALLIGLLAGGLAAALQVSQNASLYQGGGIGAPLYALDSAAQDLALQARRPDAFLQVTQAGQVAVARDPRDLIRIIAIDERTIGELGAYGGGYPRQYHAELIDRLLVAPPRVIGFDLGFFEPSSDDVALAAAIERAVRARTRVVLAGVGLFQRSQPIGRASNGELRFPSGLVPVAVLSESTDLGLSNVLPDDRGTIRGMPLLSFIGRDELPTFGLALVAAYLRRQQPIDGRPSSDSVDMAGRRIPVDGTSSVRINYFGPPSEPYAADATFQTMSFSDVVRGRLDPEAWRDRIVVVGASGAAGLADDYWTPLSSDGRKMSGVEIHANVAATLFSTQFLRAAPLVAQVALILGSALLISLGAAALGPATSTMAAVVLLASAMAASLASLYALGLQLPMANVVLGGVLAFVGMTAWRVGIEQRQARGLQRALASVVPPSVAQQIARAPERVRMGGERRTLSLLFTDLRGFTTFAETVEPDVLSKVIGEYLSAMTRAVFDHGGTVDKFIGDAVMAFWNAPLDDVDHARHACATALAMQTALDELNCEWAKAGLPSQHMRIGIHTGVASVGNMGTAQRFAYTASGDTVNVAARLEPLNEEYGTQICVSREIVTAAGDGFLVRYLDLVALKGKSTPVAVYELLGFCNDAKLTARSAPILKSFEDGVRMYQARDFAAAAEIFASVNGTDAPSEVLRARCAAFAAEPPPPDWDGVHVMTHK